MRAFGSEAAFIAAIEAGEIDRLAAVPGIGAHRAAELVRAARGAENPSLFGTPRVEELFAGVRARIAERARTRAGRNEIGLLGPLPDRGAREARTAWALAARDEVHGLDLEEARGHLARLTPLPDLRPAHDADVILFVDTHEDQETLLAAGIDGWAEIASAADVDTALEARAGIYAYSEGGAALEEADHILAVPFTTDLAALVPWAIIERHRRARASLEAAAALSTLRATQSAAAEALEALAALPPPTARLDAGTVEAAAQVALEEALAAADAELGKITLTGADLVRAMASEPPAAVRRVYHAAVQAAKRGLAAKTGLDLDAYTDDLPPRVDAEALRAAADEAERLGVRMRLQRQQEVAKRLVRLEPAIERERADHEAFDARQAVGSFVAEHSLSGPIWGQTLHLDGLLHMDLSPGGDPVHYALGDDGARIALLTGANSGGKTTLIEAIAQTVALAHCGFPVPARRAVVPEIDTIHVFAHKRSLGAGAFESFLRRLFPVADTPGRVLVLADELEAMTELEAAAEIIAAFLERLAVRGALAVVATHMAPHILPALNDKARGSVRIDGIEARGLAEDGTLLVDRSPRMGHLARSTPELILRRLAGHGPAELRPVFAQLAERLKRHS